MRTQTLILAAALTVATHLNCPAKTEVGKAGDWLNTIAATGLNGILYTVESSGNLYATTPADGTWQKIGKPDFANTTFLLAFQDKLVSIEKDGSLYLIDPKDGSYRQTGKADDWANTIAAAIWNSTLYTVEAGGSLYATTPADGSWKKIGKPDFANTAFLFPLKEQLASIEKDGTLYLINPADGTWQPSGKGGDWKDTLAGGACNGKLYTVSADGTLYVTDTAIGTKQTVESAQYPGTTHLPAVGSQLYAISDKGNLSSVSAAGANPAQPTAKKIENANPALAGKLTFKFMGKWKGDTAEFEKDPEFQKQKQANPEMIKGLVDLMNGMIMNVTLDGVTMTVMGQTVGPYPFEALSASEATLFIENKEGPKKGQRSRIIFQDDKHIQVIEDDNAGKAMFFKKD